MARSSSPCFVQQRTETRKVERRIAVQVIVAQSVAVHLRLYQEHALARPRDRTQLGGGIGRHFERARQRHLARFPVRDPDRTLHGMETVVDGNDLAVVANHHKFVLRRLPNGGVGLLLAEIPIYDAIREDRPSVAQVPPQEPPRAPLARTRKLDPRLQGLGLRVLRGQNEILQLVRRLAEQHGSLLRHERIASVPAAARTLFGIGDRRLALPLGIEGKLVLCVGPGINAFRRHHLLQRFHVGTSVIAGLADERGRIRRPERALEILRTRPPQVILRKLRLASDHVGRPPGRRRDVGRERIEVPQNARQSLAADAVAGGIRRVLAPMARDRTVLLVVGAPERKARMRPEPHDYRPRLIRDGLRKGIVLPRFHVAHHEVLPDQNAVPVAEIIERIRFIDPAAPDANHVAVQVHEHVEAFLEMLRIARVEGVHGRPVAAVHIDRRPVYDEAKRAGILLRMPVGAFEAHRPEADLADVARQDATVAVEQFRRGVVKFRLPGGARPPEVGVLHPHPVEGLGETVGMHTLRHSLAVA